MEHILKTNSSEFEKFIKNLMNNAPKGYYPWLFPVNGKAPGVAKGISWKSEKARLTIKEAINRLKQGKNVGISGRANDPLIIIDIDDKKYRDQLKPTLIIRSRKRVGFHAFYWADHKDKRLPINIPTDSGEIRSSDQYVVCSGSFVNLSNEDIDKMIAEGKASEEDKQRIINDPNRGVYTVETARQPTTITFDELPELFLDKVRENEKKTKEIEAWRKGNPLTKVNLTDKHSALFDLRITDVAPSQPKSDRFPHPLHDSDTGQNFSIDGDLAHCWRHLVSLNAIQYLVVKSGYLSCEDAGTGHKGSHQSYVIGDDGAIFFAWLEAKKMGVIPKDDPVPINALLYIARMHKVCDAKLIPNRNEYETKRLPMDAWNKCLLIIEEEY